MSERILLDFNPTTGVSTYYRTDPNDPDSFLTEKVWDRGGIDKVNHEQRVTTSGEKFGDLRHYARIPPAIVGQLMREGRLHDPAAMREWLRKEGREWRTFEKVW